MTWPQAAKKVSFFNFFRRQTGLAVVIDGELKRLRSKYELSLRRDPQPTQFVATPKKSESELPCEGKSEADDEIIVKLSHGKVKSEREHVA